MNKKILSKQRRAKRLRAQSKRAGKTRLTVNRSLNHIYAQVISPEGSVVAQASTLDKDLKKDIGYAGNIAAATRVGQLVAERAKAAGVGAVVFDRSGYKYHGRVKALAEAARESGMEF